METTQAPPPPTAPDQPEHQLTLVFARRVVGLLCTALRHLADGDVHAAGEALDEAACLIDLACDGAERMRYVSSVESVAQVRNLALAYIPSILEALAQREAGAPRAALERLSGLPAPLWKAAAFLFEESARRHGTPARRTRKDAFFESSGSRNRETIERALAMMLASPYLEWVVCEAVGTGRQVRFRKTEAGEVELQLALDQMEVAEQRRIEVFFSNMDTERSDDQFLVSVGQDTGSGAKLAVGIFEIIFDVDADQEYDLTVEVT